MATYKHGIYVTENATSITPTVEVDFPPVVICTAPAFLADEPKINVPVLCTNLSDVEKYIGYNGENSTIWDNFTGVQAAYALFNLYGVTPAVFINIFDPDTHVTSTSETIAVISGTEEYTLEDLAILSSVEITDLTVDEDYSLDYDDNGNVVITLLSETALALESLSVSYNKADVSTVTDSEIIGGYDEETGLSTGISAIDDIYPRLRVVPGAIAMPGLSSDAALANVLAVKAASIGGMFKAITLIDLPTVVDGARLSYTEAAAYKIEQSFDSERMVLGFGNIVYDDKTYYYSTQLLGAMCSTDADYDNIPSKSPSNIDIFCSSVVYADGTEMLLSHDKVCYLNGQGIVTAFNSPNGYVTFGNRTGIYPDSTDPKDAFIAIRRMFDYVNNQIILNNWKKIDSTMTKRVIDSVVDDTNAWLNSLTSREHILGGEISFNEADNPTESLVDGIVTFRIMLAPPPPIRAVEDTLEYDTSYISTLFE